MRARECGAQRVRPSGARAEEMKAKCDDNSFASAVQVRKIFGYSGFGEMMHLQMRSGHAYLNTFCPFTWEKNTNEKTKKKKMQTRHQFEGHCHNAVVPKAFRKQALVWWDLVFDLCVLTSKNQNEVVFYLRKYAIPWEWNFWNLFYGEIAFQMENWKIHWFRCRVLLPFDLSIEWGISEYFCYITPT